MTGTEQERTMMDTEPLTTTVFDTDAFLETGEDQAEYLDEALATGDRRVIVAAIGRIARVRGMADLARQSGIRRTTLYASLAEAGNPTLDTLLAVLSALDLRLASLPRASG